jgi:hypothetical protein
MTKKATQATEKKQSTHKRNTSGLIPFKPGYDARRNMNGRNVKGFDDVRKIFQEHGNDNIEVTLNGKRQKVSRFDVIALAMASDKKMMNSFLEWAVGKVPQPVTGTGKDGAIELVVKYATDKKPDDQSP